MVAGSTSIQRVQEHWQAFKAIETRGPEDIERQLALLTHDVVMENPMLRAQGRDEVRDFLLRDIHWSKPVIDWECFSSDRVAFRWSQHPLCSEKTTPKLLHSCATWRLDESGLLSHYYATWCRVEAFRVMRDAGMSVRAENFVGPELDSALRTE